MTDFIGPLRTPVDFLSALAPAESLRNPVNPTSQQHCGKPFIMVENNPINTFKLRDIRSFMCELVISD
ncbi:hypothetical protein HJB79_02110 [Rhizobium lentis]|uniref:hypothetical protein n=1 Tax=Rhizobium TaxID=379 RepID=UPI00160E5EAF|nr:MULTISPECIES: hypothetical protein [Rhizobium]MBB3353094.1 hypothetical protein [Rhizobium sp. BK049]MBX5131513.1 hypothetical protein [Rhizobium lentis]MBX5137606.1 hypothetical protein [Rhizobium lentis]